MALAKAEAYEVTGATFVMTVDLAKPSLEQGSVGVLLELVAQAVLLSVATWVM